jgi:uncharacterized protein YbjT (DUF2867 family)
LIESKTYEEKHMILVTGVNGRVGGAAANYLLNQGVAVRGVARDADKAASLRERGMELVIGDLGDSATVNNAVQGVSSALLVFPNTEQQLEVECGFAAAAALSGVGHLVKVSSMEAGPEAEAIFPATHYKAEEFIRSLGLHSSILRPNFYMQNLLMYAQAIAQTGSFSMPLGKAKTGLIDARDVGEIAGRILMQPANSSQSYPLSGPALMDFHEVAACMSGVLGREIEYVEQSPADFRAFMERIIPNAWHANAVCELFEQIAQDTLAEVTDDSAKLLGHPPTSLEKFISDHAKAFGA